MHTSWSLTEDLGGISTNVQPDNLFLKKDVNGPLKYAVFFVCLNSVQC